MAVLTPAIVFTQLIVLIFAVLITAWVVLLLSHRIAGPLYRLERVAERVGGGDLTVRIGFRKEDALLPFKSSFQNMIDSLQYRLLRIRNTVLEMKDLGVEAERSIDSSSLPEPEKERLRGFLREYTARYENSLKEFTLPPCKTREESESYE
jgi:methyl-accepting chemotaxis protein